MEALLSLSLIAMISTVLFIRQARQRNEMEEVTIAESIRFLRDKLRVYVRNNTVLFQPAPGDEVTYPITYPIEVSDVFASEGGAAPDVYDGFKIVVLADEIVKGSQRMPFHGFILTPQVIKGRSLTDLSAARIAAVLGASGGVIPKTMGATVPGTAWGTMNLWQMDKMEDYFGADNLTPPRVVVNLDFSDINNDISPDMMGGILFRKHMEGFPELAQNVMEQDIIFIGKDNRQTMTIGQDGRISLDPAYAKAAAKNVGTGAGDAGTAKVAGAIPAQQYALDMAGTSVMKDLRLEKLGGAPLSEVMPRLSLQEVYREVGFNKLVPAPGYKVVGDTTLVLDSSKKPCPVGYAPAITLDAKTQTTGKKVTADEGRVPEHQCPMPPTTCSVYADCPGGTQSICGQCATSWQTRTESTHSCSTTQQDCVSGSASVSCNAVFKNGKGQCSSNCPFTVSDSGSPNAYGDYEYYDTTTGMTCPSSCGEEEEGAQCKQISYTGRQIPCQSGYSRNSWGGCCRTTGSTATTCCRDHCDGRSYVSSSSTCSYQQVLATTDKRVLGYSNCPFAVSERSLQSGFTNMGNGWELTSTTPSGSSIRYLFTNVDPGQLTITCPEINAAAMNISVPPELDAAAKPVLDSTPVAVGGQTGGWKLTGQGYDTVDASVYCKRIEEF
ncbi:hypothetical protein FACS1894186_7500 [Alphaproteobacteria bacterium]|nr:hypothetical protein FACS1894186_7500 [Alphaproteobacteria bacterium]